MSSGSDQPRGDEPAGDGDGATNAAAAGVAAAWARVFERLFDGHPSHVALVGLDGTVMAVNAAWRRYAADHGVAAGYDFVGRNYLAVCEAAVAAGYPSAQEAYVGLLDVLRNRRPKFTLTYACHSPGRREWYRMWVEPQSPSVPAVIVAHQLIDAQPHPSDDDGRGGTSAWAWPAPSTGGDARGGDARGGDARGGEARGGDPAGLAGGPVFPGWWFDRYDLPSPGGTKDRSHDRT